MQKALYILFGFLSLICTILVIITKEFLIIPIFILIIYIIFLIAKIQKQKFEIKNLNYICDTTRTFKHDFNNIMQAMGGYIKTNNIKDLQKYYDSIIAECFHVTNLYRFHSKLMVNTALYSIIADKYNLAEQLNIKMNLNILTNLNEFNLDTYHLTKIIGILLDNAIEATEECENKIINLSFETQKNSKLILIENTYSGSKINIHKIFRKNYTTKKTGSGLGLWEVNKIVNKNKNLHLQTQIDNNFFIQKLEIS